MIKLHDSDLWTGVFSTSAIDAEHYGMNMSKPHLFYAELAYFAGSLHCTAAYLHVKWL